MSGLPEHLQRELEAERIHVTAFFGVNRKDEPPFFFAAVWPAAQDDISAILNKDLFYATAWANDPEEAVRIFRDKLYGGL